MDLSDHTQKYCINGLSKEESERVKEIPDIKDSINLINEELEGVGTFIGNMQSDIQGLEQTTINFMDHFDTLDGKVRNLETETTELDERLTETQNVTIANLGTQVNTIQNQTIPVINARLNTIENTDIPEINSDISDINTAIDTINDTTIPTIQDGIELIEDNITDLYDGQNWILYDSIDWSHPQIIDNGKLVNDVLIEIATAINYSSSAAMYNQNATILLHKGRSIDDWSKYTFPLSALGTNIYVIGDCRITRTNIVLDSSTIDITTQAIGLSITGTTVSGFSYTGTRTLTKYTTANPQISYYVKLYTHKNLNQ